jgi:hypothetical protein
MRTGLPALGLLAIWIAAPTIAAAQPHAPARIVTTTRLVAQYSDLEHRLDRAIQHRDRAALDKILDDSFEQWSPAPPGEPMPRDEWMHHALTGVTLRSFRVRQMAVRTIGDTAVVSFTEDRDATCGGRECSGSRFIVDLWQARGGAPHLLVRYDSGILAQPMPSAPPTPTGK